jgi:hypothetical protein
MLARGLAQTPCLWESAFSPTRDIEAADIEKHVCASPEFGKIRGGIRKFQTRPSLQTRMELSRSVLESP